MRHGTYGNVNRSGPQELVSASPSQGRKTRSCRERISVFGESETMLCPWACTLGDTLTDIIYICVDSSLANLVAIRP
jgi:hypothetical protein